MFSRTEVGQIKHWKSGTKNAKYYTWSKQSFNLFNEQQNESNVLSEKSSIGNAQVSQDDSATFKSSTKVHAAPGGRSNMSSIFSQSSENAPAQRRSSTKVAYHHQSNIFAAPAPVQKRPSTKVHAAPGGRSEMSSLISGSSQAAPHAKYGKGANHPSSHNNNIFGETTEYVKPSTRRLAAPGGQSGMSQVMAHQCPPPSPHGIKTGKMNESKNIVNLTPTSDKYVCRRTYKANESNNVMNLTPAPMKKTTSRTAKMNEECETEAEPKVLEARFSVRNQMLASNIFSAPENDGDYHSSTKVHHAPGGANSGNIISWN